MAPQARIPMQRTSSDTADLTAAGRPRRGRGHRQGPSVPLGSLTQRDHRPTAGCSGCGSPHVTRLAMNLTDGTPVDFTSCHRCEHRAWEHAGAPISVQGVLDRTRKIPAAAQADPPLRS